MKRNQSIDFFRAVAILYILLYHFYVYCGYPYADIRLLNRVICIGGEIGVTLFFLISGYGIYYSLANTEKREGGISYPTFARKRFLRIAPQYYAAIGVLLLFTENAGYLSGDGFFQIIAHILFIHNWFPATFDKFSGVWWTLGSIVQFYAAAVFLYRAVKRHSAFYFAAVLFSIAMKIILYHYVPESLRAEKNYYFIYGRQVFTALDNFVLGMVLAKWMIQEKKFTAMQQISFLAPAAAGLVFLVILTENHSPYTDSLMGYVWHSALALCLAVMIFAVSVKRTEYFGKIAQGMKFIAKYQYGIYIWHQLIAVNLMQNSSMFHFLARENFILYTLFTGCICIAVGYITSKCFVVPSHG